MPHLNPSQTVPPTEGPNIQTYKLVGTIVIQTAKACECFLYRLILSAVKALDSL